MSEPTQEKKPEEIVEELQKEKGELVDKVASFTQDVTNLTEEITKLREDRRKYKEELEEKNKDGLDDVTKTVQEVLSKRDQDSKEVNFNTAIDAFKVNHPEFAQSNDAGGIKFKRFEQELSKFNTSELVSERQINSRLEEVYEFMNRSNKPNPEPVITPYASTPKGGGATPQVDDNPTLDSREKKLIEKQGWTVERFMKVKEKRPAYIRTLLQYTND